MMVLTESSPMTAELRGAVQRYSELARSAADDALQLPGSEWTVREAVAHVTSVAPRYAKFPYGTQRLAGTPAELPALNGEEIKALGERPVAELLTVLADAVDAVIGQVQGFADQPPQYRFHGGGLVTADVALGILLGELVVHGWDIARALHRPWPVTRRQVSLIWSGVEPILPGWVDPASAAGHHGAYQVHLGDGRRHVLCFTSGTLSTQLPAGRRIQCHIGGSPEAILLILYRRLSPWRAALTGRVAAWGPRPWLAFSLADRFYLP
jgi:uncharacterized protein (TIGR03083 family)